MIFLRQLPPFDEIDQGDVTHTGIRPVPPGPAVHSGFIDDETVVVDVEIPSTSLSSSAESAPARRPRGPTPSQGYLDRIAERRRL